MYSSSLVEIDYSSIVVNIGGVAAYPSIIKDTNNYGDLFKTHAHEWLHQYLILFPLGRAYFKDPNMKIVNETLANIYSERLFNNVRSKKIELQDFICKSKVKESPDKFNYEYVNARRAINSKDTSATTKEVIIVNYEYSCGNEIFTLTKI